MTLSNVVTFVVAILASSQVFAMPANATMLTVANDTTRPKVTIPTAPEHVRQLDTAIIFIDKLEQKTLLTKGRERDNPEAIQNEKSLKQIVEDKLLRERISRHVNFDTEQLILIAWRGGSNNEAHTVKVSNDGRSVVFIKPPIRFELSKGERSHVYLYVIHKDAKWIHTKATTRK